MAFFVIYQGFSSKNIAFYMEKNDILFGLSYILFIFACSRNK